MTKTQIQKAFAAIALFAIATSNFGAVSAVQIGTGSVDTDASFDTVIDWNETFTNASASGSVTDIIIRARVNPTLNMTISTGSIDLGVLVSGTPSLGSLAIEVGTNAVNGVSITARSQSGGLTNTSDNSVQINDLSADGLQESYTWASTVANDNTANDSSFSGFDAINTGTDGLDIAKEIVNTTTEYNVYTSNSPEASTLAIDDVTFNVSAQSEDETPAGEYEDRVTFTVTGNF